MIKKYNISIIGALAEIASSHINAIKNHPYFNLKTVCDLDREKLHTKFSDLAEEQIFTDYKKAITYPDIDIVVILTPNQLHKEIIIEALNHNKIVLCEKPLAVNLAEIKQIEEALKQSQGFVYTSYHFSFAAELIKFLEIKDQFGQIIEFQFFSSEPIDKNKPWTLQFGGGVWLDMAPNALSVLRAVLAENNKFQSLEITKADFECKNYEADIKADVELELNNISGSIKLDWLGESGFQAKTILTTAHNQQIILDHVEHFIKVGDKIIWQGQNQAYDLIYQDFLVNLEQRQSNLGISRQDLEIIEQVLIL